ncbi:four-carbon acid sugar kinase family protein [Shouchella clausii]|uniref:Hydroxyacid dehydrogenase n=1 Tax=Shouchella clausii TaxID=79880 RepID=A0A268S283_SHOCL|nr:four-carbon acid sugar kinase family protein [Shouchella clausii]AST95109.1 hydroxyacid dehydrogenase [Shouchella clausii]MCY1102838.1 hydroxyacid dehydrogenase [Shouchella clausii]MEB5474611.1 four-carbon acid sugar kinase family protein [Shouchella clausii]MEB5479820.1 four-carbon acid sugar kinase family protein [Shouchella clausii]MED4159850.1 four-carbon acid sugar kinase family protein [Shouchella clausii]
MKHLHAKTVLNTLPAIDRTLVQQSLEQELKESPYKMIVLDDDPTGIQTVHGVSVYTDWSETSIRAGFRESNRLFFLLTNSRSFTRSETTACHKEIAERVQRISEEEGIPYVLVSRGDSTLRGHYPLETDVLKQTIEGMSEIRFDGEVVMPFFKEGGRLTIGDVHYVQDGESLVPAGETEFAKDRTFSFSASHLGEWVEEKTEGEYTKEQTIYIRLQDLREKQVDYVKEQLMKAQGFQKIVVNAVEYSDVEIFVTAFIKALKAGKRFLVRSAASLTKVLGGVADKPLLKKDDLVDEAATNGGLVIVGSHVKKTTEQLRQLLDSGLVEGVELDVHLVLYPEQFEREVARVRRECEAAIASGRSVVCYTRRERLDLGDNQAEEELKLAVNISDAVTSIVSDLQVRPKYIVAKGGITSSSIGTKGLAVKRAEVLGQIQPGIPVWKTGNESKFANATYIIFPGNVGRPETLKEVVEELEQ